MNAVEIENLTKIYFRSHLFRKFTTTALSRISFVVNHNEIFGIIGPNGAGKTTLLKIIVGLLRPTEGSLKIYGMNNLDALDIVGYLPEVIKFFGDFTVNEFLRNIVRFHKNTREIDEVLNLVALEARDKKIKELSKGMQQRLGIAQSIIHDPKLLIYDEPSSGLDPIGIKFMRDFILRMKDEGRSVIFSSHIIGEVEKICDRVAVISNGKLKQIFTKNDFSKKPLEELFLENI